VLISISALFSCPAALSPLFARVRRLGAGLFLRHSYSVRSGRGTFPLGGPRLSHEGSKGALQPQNDIAKSLSRLA
jgi:hypothetical protein